MKMLVALSIVLAVALCAAFTAAGMRTPASRASNAPESAAASAANQDGDDGDDGDDGGGGGAADDGFSNLQVLPDGISDRELGAIMLANTRGLGLPRLGGEGCLYCHVGDMETPRSEWDFAADDKPMKDKARVMMEMTAEINANLARLETRIDPDIEVTCTTCHAGRTDPRALPDVLFASYEDGGVEAAEEKYRELRDRYYGADAYDFRVHILPALATHLANRGDIDDAIALAALNVEVHPGDAAAKRSWLALHLERIIDAKDVKAALAELDELAPTLAADVLTPSLFNSMSWRLIRSDRAPQGHALIEANLARFPEKYLAIESMAFIYADTDRMEQAIDLLERWLEKNPEHDRGRRLLINLREE